MDYTEFKRKFAWLTGFDLNSYKEQQMERRIRQFMDRANADSFYDYFKILEKNEPEKIKFLNFLTINTTIFFRDPQVFRKIKEEVLPDILKRKKRWIKIWSAGCSNGAEPYSLSILMIELLGRRIESYRYSIIATDIDPGSLNQAETALYSPTLLDHVSQSSLKKYFSPVGNKLQVKPKVKENVIFKQHDLLKDPYEKNCDLILCRNVFIYFTKETQNRLMAEFIKALLPGSYFIMGCCELLNNYEQWGLEKKHLSIYQKV